MSAPLRKTSHVLYACAILVGAALLGSTEPGAKSGPDGLRYQLIRAHRRGEQPRAIELGERLLSTGQDLGTAGVDLVEAYLARGEYQKPSQLLCDGKVRGPSADLLNRAGMGLHCGNASQIKLAVCCLKQALEKEPKSLYYRFNLVVTYWNGGYLPEAKLECERVLAQDGGNVQAQQILQRIEKQGFSTRLRSAHVARRRVELSLRVPRGVRPVIAGSWNRAGRLDQFHGFEPVPMKRVRGSGRLELYTTAVDLDTETGRWYSAVVWDAARRGSAQRPAAPAPWVSPGTPIAFCRFPVYPIWAAPLGIRLDDHPAQPPTPFLAPRPPLGPPPGARGRGGARAGTDPPRTILICIDSETWDIVMPLVRAGVMPRLAELMATGSFSEILSDPPVSTIAFDRLNFGASGTFGWLDWLADTVETLKERGFDLIHAGNIAGTENTWKLLARKGHPALYVSWAEQIHYGPGVKETVERTTADWRRVTVGGLEVPDHEEKVFGLLDHAEVPRPQKPTYSDGLAEDLYDAGVKRMAEAKTLLGRHSPRVAFVHFGFIDTSYHLFWDAMDPDVAFLQAGARPPRRHRRVIEGLHRLMDLIIGDLAAEVWRDGGNVIVFSDHGATGGFAATWLGHDPVGMLVAAGPSFRRVGFVQPRPDIQDIVPTLLAIYGIEPQPSYKGKPLSWVIPARPEAAAGSVAR